MHRSPQFVRSAGTVAALCLASVLPACSGSEAAMDSTGGVVIPLDSVDMSTTTALDEGATEPAPAGSAAPTATAAPAASATTLASAVAPVAGAPGSCLIGNWSVASGDVATYLGRSASAVFEDVVASGQLGLSFTASGYTWTQSARVAFTVAYDTGPVPATYSVDRTLTGSWSATAATISATNLDFDGDFTITENGVEPDDTGDLFLGVVPFDPVDGMSYSCDGPTVNLRLSDFGPESLQVTLIPS